MEQLRANQTLFKVVNTHGELDANLPNATVLSFMYLLLNC